MAIAFVQGQSASSSSQTSPQTLAFGSNNAASNALVVYAIIQNATTMTGISDSQGNTYTNVYSNVTTGGGQNASLWYALNIKSGANTVSITTGSNGWNMASVTQEFSGVATSSAADGNNHSSGSWSGSNPTTGPSVTTTNANDVIVGGFMEATTATMTAGTGYSNATASTGGTYSIGMDSKVVAATGTYSPTMNTTVTGFGGDFVTLALKAVAAASGPIARDVQPLQNTLGATFFQGVNRASRY